MGGRESGGPETERRGTSHCHRGDAASDVCKNERCGKKRTARTFEEEARSTRNGASRTTGRTHFPQAPDAGPDGLRADGNAAELGCLRAKGNRSGTRRPSGRREPHSGDCLEPLGLKRRKRRNRPRPKGFGRNRSKGWKHCFGRVDTEGRVGAGGDTGPHLLSGPSRLPRPAQIAGCAAKGPSAPSAIHTAMAIIIRFSVNETKPKGTLLAPPTHAHFSVRFST